jgi:polycystin 2
LLTIILSFICILYELIIDFSTRKSLGELLRIENNYPNFDELFTLKINSDFYLGLTLAITWLKIFKYLNLNKTMLLLNKTISSCLNEIFAFICIFLIIFLAYTQIGWLLFGRYLTEWRSFPESM